MERRIPWPLSAVFLATAVSAADLPQLRLSSLSGRLSVRPPEEFARTLRAETAAALPELMPGTRVDVLEGEAVFESDWHAVVRARSGGSFRYHAEKDALRLASVPGMGPVDVEIEGALLRLVDGGSVAVGRDGAVEIEQAEVALLDGSVLRAGESLTTALPGRPGRGFTPGDGLALDVPEERGYLLVAASPAELRLSAFEIGRAQPRSLARLEPVDAEEQAEMRMAVGPAPTLRPVPQPRTFPAQAAPETGLPASEEAGSEQRRLTRNQWAVLGIISGTALLAGLELWRHLNRG